MILTDAHGKPFAKPAREDYADVTSYLRACWAYNDAIANEANRAFAEGFAGALKSGKNKAA